MHEWKLYDGGEHYGCQARIYVRVSDGKEIPEEYSQRELNDYLEFILTETKERIAQILVVKDEEE